MNEKNNGLQNNINDLEVKLATRDEELAEAVSNNVKPLQVGHEKMYGNIGNRNFNCELCEFKAKSSCGLKTHIGHMHKVNERNTELAIENENDETTITEALISSSVQVFTCKLCGKEFQIQEDSTRHAYAHVILQSVDMTPIPYSV